MSATAGYNAVDDNGSIYVIVYQLLPPKSAKSREIFR